MSDIVFAAYLPAKDIIPRPFVRILYDENPTADQVRYIGQRLAAFLSEYPIKLKEGNKSEIQEKKEQQEVLNIDGKDILFGQSPKFQIIRNMAVQVIG